MAKGERRKEKGEYYLSPQKVSPWKIAGLNWRGGRLRGIRRLCVSDYKCLEGANEPCRGARNNHGYCLSPFQEFIYVCGYRSEEYLGILIAVCFYDITIISTSRLGIQIHC